MGTIETPLVPPHPVERMHLAETGPGPGLVADGSVEDHHLDDLPYPPGNELSADPPVLASSASTLNLRRDALAVRTVGACNPPAPPCLAGPLRPPRDAAPLG